MKTAIRAGWLKAARVVALGLVMSVVSLPAFAQVSGQLFATQEDGYARLILSFPGEHDLPGYTMRVENGVLSLTFDEKVAIMLPDVGTTMPDYLSVARIDPDGRGLRIGLRSTFNFNRIEAGEKLFIDLMPNTWQGMPPALPQDVVAELAERARLAAIETERKRKADDAAALDPKASVRIGRNPTFMRVQFDWNVPTTAQYVQDEQTGIIAFEWPVGVDMRELMANLPPEIATVETAVTPDGATVKLVLAKDVKPRFYQNSARQYVLDVDIAHGALPVFTAASLADGIVSETPEADVAAVEGPRVDALYPQGNAETVTPFVSVLGTTVRVVFPFEQDTPAAVFRRGDTVWMMFDTVAGIAPPAAGTELDELADAFDVLSAGDTQVVRINLSQDRLATLGSEGMAWVLSLGDIVLTPTEPIQLSRRRDIEGSFEMVADVARPGRVHEFRDPDVGDILKIVTAYPPARGVTRTLDYVEFAALRSVHGLIIKPEDSGLGVTIDNDLAVISLAGGLTVSALDAPRSIGSGVPNSMRTNFVDLGQLEQPDAGKFNAHRGELLTKAATSNGRQRDVARLDLAQYYIANDFAFEAMGVLRTLQSDLSAEDLARKVRMAKAMADTIAVRPQDALAVLNQPMMGQDIDALLWRTIARTDAQDFRGARLDAIEALQIAPSYPLWVRNKFYFAAIRAAVETADSPMAERVLELIDFAGLSIEEASLYQLMGARIDEDRGRTTEAIDAYGQVISADIRPTRAEAVFRTLVLLDKAGTLDLAKASQTLAAESLLWRGNGLEAEMQKLLADLYFREGAFREGFEVARQAVGIYPDTPSVNALRDEAQATFSDLFLNGRADSLGPVDALSLYYDFRELTPPGTRGDEMIRNLARRLVKVDLLPQAASLLEYQLDQRLRGIARTQVATDLAVIYLADRKPQDALRVLNNTRLPNLPDGLARQRKILEARAMIDGGREQLALDMLRDMSGRDADLLRIDSHWKARRYTQASEMLEAMYADPAAGTLSQPARMNVIKAAVGYVLADDTMGLSRLRAKFGDRMVTAPEWPMFDFVTGPLEVSSLQFKQVASQVAGMDSLNAFLASYKEAYSGADALTPATASAPDAGMASR